MKNLLTLALAALLLNGSAFAYTPKPTDSVVPSTPAIKLVPTKVVDPSNLPRSFTRGVVTIEFSLDASGQPQQIQVLSREDRAVREQVVKAFKQWKFDPKAAVDGKRYVMPVEVVVPGA